MNAIPYADYTQATKPVLYFLKRFKEEKGWPELTLTLEHILVLHQVFSSQGQILEGEYRAKVFESEHVTLAYEDNLFFDMWIDIQQGIARVIYAASIQAVDSN